MMKVMAGDWAVDSNVVIKTTFTGKLKSLAVQKGMFSFEHIEFSAIKSVQLVSEHEVRSVLKKVGWGLAGGVLFGAVGAAAGALAAGNKEDRVLAVVLKDERKLFLKGTAKEAATLNAFAYKWEK